MHKKAQHTFALFSLLLQMAALPLIGEVEKSSVKNNENSQTITKPFDSFTGRITRNKVRLRLQPSLEASILKEFTKDDLVMVTGEAEEFYSILPPKDSKAYIFRTFVLDNKIEGNKVNVRLEPALEAPIIAQLNSGDEISGVISPLNNKWYEIAPPASTRFYVCKEYVEKIGSPAVMAQIEKRREEVNDLLNRSYQISQQELQKNYSSMNLDPAINGYNKIIKDYGDFPDQSARAKELLGNLQEILLRKKVEYLEAKAAGQDLGANTKEPQQKEQQITIETIAVIPDDNFGMQPPPGSPTMPSWKKLFDPVSMTGKMAAWIPYEKYLYDGWASGQPSPSLEAFYEMQLPDMVTLTGILEPYSRNVKNKPGDYLLISAASNFPIAYLYSTSINLQEKLGHVATVHALKRPNNNFAFPAFFVIAVD